MNRITKFILSIVLFSQTAYVYLLYSSVCIAGYENLKETWDKPVSPSDFSRLCIPADRVSQKKPDDSDKAGQSYTVELKYDDAADLTLRGEKNQTDKQEPFPYVYTDLSCLNESRPGVPVVFQYRAILLRRLYYHGRNIYFSDNFIRKCMDMYLQNLFWEYENSEGKQIVERVYSPGFFSNEPNPLCMDMCGVFRYAPPEKCCDWLPGTVFMGFFSVPSPANTNIKNLKLRWTNLTCSVPVEAPFESNFVGNKGDKCLSFIEYQNLLLFSQRQNINPDFYPFGDWALENYLTVKELKQFELALQKKDPYALMMYYQYFGINHVSVYKIQRNYRPERSLNVPDPLVRFGMPLSFYQPPTESDLKQELNQYPDEPRISYSGSGFFPPVELCCTNWNWEIIRKSYNPEVIGALSQVPRSCQVNIHKFLFDRKRLSNRKLITPYFSGSDSFNYFFPEFHEALKEFIDNACPVARRSAELDLSPTEKTYPLD